MRARNHGQRPELLRNLSPLVLASQSPRRRELLARLGLRFEVHPPGVEEPSPAPGVSPAEHVLGLARLKARAVAPRFPQAAVLAADTVVAVEGQILGKPRDAAEARKMLALLSGRWHEVVTAYCLLFRGEERAEAAGARVLFRRLSPPEIEAYLATGEPFDKAGAYAVQGIASCMVRRVEGSVTGIVGLPLAEVVEAMFALGIASPEGTE